MAESQLPAAADQQLATEVGAQNIIILIVYLVLILVAAYFVTKYVAKRALTKGMKKQQTKKTGIFRTINHEPGSLVSVADRIAVDKDKTVMVVEFNGKYYLMSTTQHDIKCIDKVDVPPEDLTEHMEEDEAGEKDTASYAAAQQQYANEGFVDYLKGIGRQIKGYFTKGKAKKNQAGFDAQLKEKMAQQSAKDETGDKEE